MGLTAPSHFSPEQNKNRLGCQGGDRSEDWNCHESEHSDRLQEVVAQAGRTMLEVGERCQRDLIKCCSSLVVWQGGQLVRDRIDAHSFGLV